MSSNSALSNFFRDLPETIQQPAALAMLGSLGAHLILFATLPAFTSSPDPAQSEIRRVRLLEPPQDSSAPQASTSRLGLPPVSNNPNSKLQLPQAGQTIPSVPNPLYTLPDLTPVPVPSNPQPQRRFFENPLTPAERAALFERLRRLQTPPTPPPKPPAQPPQNQKSPTDGLNQADPTVAASPPPSGQVAPNSPPATPPSPFVPQTPNDRFLVATNYNPQGTTKDEQTSAQIKFTQAAAQKGLNWERILLRQPDAPIQEIPYPANLKGKWQPKDFSKVTPTAIAVIVGKDGKILVEPEIIGSTGYGILNESAMEIVKATTTPEKMVELIQEHEANKEDVNSRNKAESYLIVYEFKFKAPDSAVSTQP
ncbi:MAG: hypothetical protein MUC48_07790 [Leptolyngbya sp. Prado105]|nr:hypothetical protein [Leptolyngbya sp. Prado105]